MRRRPLRLTLGDVQFEVLPDGRVRVVPSPTTAVGSASRKEDIYPSLRTFLDAVRNK